MPTIKKYQEQNKNAEYAYKFYLNKGYTPAQSSAIVGNLIRESGLNPSAVGDNGKAFGLAQWHPDRQAKAKELYGEAWKDFDNQLKFIDWELNNTEKPAGDALKKAKSVWEAGRVFTNSYERPKLKFDQDETRQTHVADVYRNYAKMQLTEEDKNMFKLTFAKDVAPYMNQESTTPLTNFDISIDSSNFASVPDVPQKEEKPSEALNKLKEEAFIQEYKSFYNTEQPIVQQEQDVQPIQPTDVTGIFNDVSQFVDAPVMQSGGRATRQDSLNVYNNSKQVEEYYRKKGYKSSDGLNQTYKSATEANDASYKDFKGNHSKLKVNIENGTLGQKIFGLDNEDYRQNIDKNKYKQREHAFSQLDMGAPMQLFDKRIEPLETKTIGNKSDLVQLHTYNTIANKPFDLLTEKEKAERVRNYGRDGVPKSYKLPEEVTKPSTTQRQQVRPVVKPVVIDTPQVTPLQQIQTKGLIEYNQEINSPLATIKPQAQMPKYWNVTDTNNQRFGGGDTNYKVYPETLNTLRELPQEGWERKATPTYQQGGGEIVKDDNGYWNPDNWGKRVEISGGNITMKGVNQPLEGYSPETGERKIMFPNMDYKFPGAKRVIETPLKQNEIEFLKSLR